MWSDTIKFPEVHIKKYENVMQFFVLLKEKHKHFNISIFIINVYSIYSCTLMASFLVFMISKLYIFLFKLSFCICIYIIFFLAKDMKFLCYAFVLERLWFDVGVGQWFNLVFQMFPCQKSAGHTWEGVSTALYSWLKLVDLLNKSKISLLTFTLKLKIKQ